MTAHEYIEQLKKQIVREGSMHRDQITEEIGRGLTRISVLVSELKEGWNCAVETNERQQKTIEELRERNDKLDVECRRLLMAPKEDKLTKDIRERLLEVFNKQLVLPQPSFVLEALIEFVRIERCRAIENDRCIR